MKHELTDAQRTAFEAWYIADANAQLGSTALTPEKMQALREGCGYGINRNKLNGKWLSWQAAFDAKDAEIAETDKVFAAHQRTLAKQSAEIAALRQDALRAATTAFGMMVCDRPDELPEDAQAIAQWVGEHVLPTLPDEAGPEGLFIDIIRKAMAQAVQP